MANKNENKKSGLNAPAYGTMLPDGAKLRKKANGNLEVVYPNENKKSGAKNKKK